MTSEDFTVSQNGKSVPSVPTGMDSWRRLLLPRFQHNFPPVRNANKIHEDSLTPMERLASKITEQVGSMGFFNIILAWTVIWCGYNILASEVHWLHWKAFDPFPAFVAYLLMSNVIQILLMPLIMVGQNVQGRHAETRAELDFEINNKAEEEVKAVLRQLERNNELLLLLLKRVGTEPTEEELRLLSCQ